MSVVMSVPRLLQPEMRMIQLAQEGSDPAREELAGYCRRIAFVFALQACGNLHDAQDLAQEAVLKFFGALDRFHADRPVRPWLLQITRNLIRDRARRARVRRLEPLFGEGEMVVCEPSDPHPSPETAAGRHEQQRLVWLALQRLTENDREILTMRDYLDLSYDEIAAALGIPRGTVMSRLHRARRRLRDEFLKKAGKPREVRHD